jgi:hypothetical protein
MPEVLALQCLSNSLDSELPRLELPIFPRVGTAMPFALPILPSGLLIVRRLCAVGILANMATMAGSVLMALLLLEGCSGVGTRTVPPGPLRLHGGHGRVVEEPEAPQPGEDALR